MIDNNIGWRWVWGAFFHYILWAALDQLTKVASTYGELNVVLFIVFSFLGTLCAVLACVSVVLWWRDTVLQIQSAMRK